MRPSAAPSIRYTSPVWEALDAAQRFAQASPSHAAHTQALTAAIQTALASPAIGALELHQQALHFATVQVIEGASARPAEAEEVLEKLLAACAYLAVKAQSLRRG